MKDLNNKGYTLIEILITFSILVVGLIGYLALAVKTLALEPIGKDKLIATELAQEGIEIIRNIRDTNWMDDTVSFDYGLFNALDYTLVVNYDTSVDDLINDASDYFGPQQIDSINTELYYDSLTDNYLHLFVPPTADQKKTKFKRLIKTEPICDCFTCCTVDNICQSGDNCGDDDKIGIQITSLVQWKSKGLNYQVEVIEQIYDWDVETGE